MDSPGTVFPQPSFFLTNFPRLVALLILAAALLAPIWSAAFPPLLDYPNHLARSFVLAHLSDPTFAFSRFYRADWGAYPYLGMDASLAFLGRLFTIETAGRVFLSLCALALPAAAWFFLRQVNPDDDATPLWGASNCLQHIFPGRLSEFRFEHCRWLTGPRALAALAGETEPRAVERCPGGVHSALFCA